MYAHLDPGKFREEWRARQVHYKRRPENKTPRRTLIESLNVGDPVLRLDGSITSVSATAHTAGKALGRAFICKTHPISRQIIVWRLR